MQCFISSIYKSPLHHTQSQMFIGYLPCNSWWWWVHGWLVAAVSLTAAVYFLLYLCCRLTWNAWSLQDETQSTNCKFISTSIFKQLALFDLVQMFLTMSCVIKDIFCIDKKQAFGQSRLSKVVLICLSLYLSKSLQLKQFKHTLYSCSFSILRDSLFSINLNFPAHVV